MIADRVGPVLCSVYFFSPPEEHIPRYTGSQPKQAQTHTHSTLALECWDYYSTGSGALRVVVATYRQHKMQVHERYSGAYDNETTRLPVGIEVQPILRRLVCPTIIVQYLPVERGTVVLQYT